MTEITKYKAENGEEFDTSKDCLDYESRLVDKNSIKLKIGDWIKESWCFHGFGYGIDNITRISNIEYKDNDKVFRLLQYNPHLRLDINRVNRMGWPVSDYEIEIITQDEVNKLEKDPNYVLRKECYYSKKQEWDK